jgi:transcriptional regulator with XRE-family HTH domain
MDPVGSDEEEVRRLLNLLRSLMRLLGFSNREVERRMGLNQGQVSRVLSGQIEAKMALVLGVARSIGLEYDELFAFAYPEPRPADQESASARSVRSLVEDILPSAGRLGRPVPAPASAPTAPSRGEAANREEIEGKSRGLGRDHRRSRECEPGSFDGCERYGFALHSPCATA